MHAHPGPEEADFQAGGTESGLNPPASLRGSDARAAGCGSAHGRASVYVGRGARRKGQESAHAPPSEGGDEKRGEPGAGCGRVAYK